MISYPALSETREILRDIPPEVWDRRGWDALIIFNVRFQLGLPNEDLVETFQAAVIEEYQANTGRYQAYAASGGRYKLTKDPITGESIVDEVPPAQAGDFVNGGRMVGDQIIAHTQYGTVNTTTDRILTFRLFQADVLRSTGQLYSSLHKKLHEQNLTRWLPQLSRVEKPADDDTSPINIIKNYMEEFLMYAETEFDRFEGSIKNKTKPILRDGKEYMFSHDALMTWLKNIDKERKWTKSQVKIYLQHIYGERFSSDKRAYNCRVLAIMLERPELPAHASLVPAATPAVPADPGEVQHDSGSGKDDAADTGRDRSAEAGSEPPRDSDPVVLQSDRPGGEGPPPPAAGGYAADVPF
jgi:hypothetical protein